MIHLKKTEAFVERVWTLSKGLPWVGREQWEDISKALSRASKNVLLLEQQDLKVHYEAFQKEFEENLTSLSREDYAAYFSELSLIFRIAPDGLQILNETSHQLMLEHGIKYRDVAWGKMQEELSLIPATHELVMEAYRFLLIATDGAMYYQAAFAEIEQQRRLTSSPPYKASTHTTPLSTLKTDPKTGGTTHGLRLRQVALIHIYEGVSLNSTLANQVAANAGFTSKTSGQKLMTHYNKLAHQSTNRTGVEAKALTDMIKDISEVLPLLSENAKLKAKSELQKLVAKK
jgi:hypothetical protein